MSLVPLAAALIREAVVDENAEQRLYETVSDKATREGLLQAEISEAELESLSPREWLWFARWRQSQGGPLDPLLLDYLGLATLSSRLARFELRSLVMRDPRTDLFALLDWDGAAAYDLGLSWLEAHAREFDDSAEVARDALQVATNAAWFALRTLTAPDHPHADQVRELLSEFARTRELSSQITEQWIGERRTGHGADHRESETATEPESQPEAGRLSEALRRVADRIPNLSGLVDARLEAVPVMGSDSPVTPSALVLPPRADAVILDPQTRATVGGGEVRIWIAGRWIAAVGSRITVAALRSDGSVASDEQALGEAGRMRFVLDWPDPHPPTEILIAVSDA